MNNDTLSRAVYAFLDGEGTIQEVEREFEECSRSQKLFWSVMQAAGCDPSLLPKILQMLEEHESALSEPQFQVP
jgi:hypothetical protein